MRIIIKYNTGEKVVLNVSPDLTIQEIKRLIKFHGQFKYVGEIMKDNLRLRDYGVEEDDIILENPITRGGGGEHICPYGCGRKIPDGFEGCTELLKVYPDYFK